MCLVDFNGTKFRVLVIKGYFELFYFSFNNGLICFNPFYHRLEALFRGDLKEIYAPG